MEALGSPIGAAAITPPLIIMAGFAAKNAGLQSTKSAILPTAIDPTA